MTAQELIDAIRNATDQEALALLNQFMNQEVDELILEIERLKRELGQ